MSGKAHVNWLKRLTTSFPAQLQMWHHVAVSVSRYTSAYNVSFYLDGAPLNSYGESVSLGGILIGSGIGGYPAMDIGHRYARYHSSNNADWLNHYFTGMLDEVEIFNRALSPAEIKQIYDAGQSGKCRDRCLVTPMTSFSSGETEEFAYVTVWNESDNTAVYHMHVFGKEPSGGCNFDFSYNGPDVFDPRFNPNCADLDPIPAHSFATFPIVITRPAGFGTGDVACYCVQLFKYGSEKTIECCGKLRGVEKWDPQPMPVPASLTLYEPVVVPFVVRNSGDSAGLLDYTISARTGCCGESGEEIVGLNDLPPGTDVTESVVVPLGDSATVSVQARLTRFVPFVFVDVSLEADLDGDMVREPLASSVLLPITFPDCNDNQIDDSVDIAYGTSLDTNGNSFPDECEFYGDTTTILSCGPQVRIEEAHSALPGSVAEVSVFIEGGSLAMGGFDFLIAYDVSALSFLSAEQGQLLVEVGWEYFTYRAGVAGNCTGGCPEGLVRLIAIADLDNGPIHPSLYGPPDTDPHELAGLRFQVSSDRNLIDQCVPIQFYWADCGDNTVSSVSGDTTYLDRLILSSLGDVLWDEDDDVQFLESIRAQGLGAPDSCLNGGGPGKPMPDRGVVFISGSICIVEPPDDRGDLNLNGIANEIGDAVLYTNYFVYGSSVWSPPYQDVQLLASDVNDDGVVLTVADLIYLIRIITGDEQPFPPGGNPKMTPYANFGSATVRTESDRLIVSTTSPVDVGGAWLIFRYSGITIGGPALLDAASGMNLRYNAEAGELRVLVHPSWDGDFASVGTGSHDILTIPTTGDGTIELVEVQMSDAQGALLSSAAVQSFVPKSYALLQNYPNPFNSGTVIAFDLVENADWDLTIYNVLGQVVRQFEGSNGTGRVSVTWDGRTDGGNSSASGIYLYRISANGFTDTKKMTLVK